MTKAGRVEPLTPSTKRGDVSPLDQSKIQTERRAATDRLLSRLQSIDRSHKAPSARAYAHLYVREQEALILQLLDAGVAAGEILADLVMTFPSIPREDLRHAIWQLRDRHRKQRPIGAASARRVPTVVNLPVTIDHGPLGHHQVAGASQDQRPDESDEDYRLRKALEGPGAIKRDFIGEV